MRPRLLATVISIVLVGGIVALETVDERSEPAASPASSGGSPRSTSGDSAPSPRAAATGAISQRTPAIVVPKPSASGTATAGRKNTFRLTLDAPPCARRGVPISVTVRTEPNADVALILSFSDGASHDSFSLGTADDRGRLVAEMPIPATAPDGPAKVFAAAGKEHLGGNVADRSFTVVGPAGSCA